MPGSPIYTGELRNSTFHEGSVARAGGGTIVTRLPCTRGMVK
jgi:hypothetical protein